MMPLRLAFDKFLERVDFAYVTRLPASDLPARYRLSFRKDGKNETAVGGSLEEILSRLLAKPKQCRGCAEWKERGQFARQPNGKRLDHCAECERKRVEACARLRLVREENGGDGEGHPCPRTPAGNTADARPSSCEIFGCH